MIRPLPEAKDQESKEARISTKTSEYRILVYDENGIPTPLFPLNDSSVTNAQSPWTGLFAEQHHVPPLEFRERIPDRHLIAMHFRPATVTWFFSGHPKTKRVKRGAVDIIPQGTRLGRYSEDETTFIMLSLEPAFVQRIAGESGKSSTVELVRLLGIHDLQIEHTILAIKAELETGCPSGQLFGDALAISLAARLLSEYSTQVSRPQGHSAVLAPYTLRRVLDYINENLIKDLTLAEIADVAHMSPHYFSRAFRHSTGIPPHRYVMNCRIKMAKKLLSETSLPLVEIGLVVGLQNQSHFTTLFHKLTGVTPKVYRAGT